MNGTQQTGVRTEKLLVDDNTLCVFKNSVLVENSFNVKVTKQMDGNQLSQDDFKVKVMVGSLPYTGQYYINGTGNAKTATNEGIITLKAGEYAEIRGLVGGNKVTVQEENLGADYNSPTYIVDAPTNNTAVKESGLTNAGDTDERNAWAIAEEGKDLGNKPEIKFTIINSLKTGSLTIEKTVNGLDDPETDLANLTFTVPAKTTKATRFLSKISC